MIPFATLNDVLAITGKSYTQTEQTRISTLLPLVSDALRLEAEKVNKNLDNMILESEVLESVAKLVTVDVVVRAMRQEMSGEPMSQESQGGLGYTWSGTYAVPGGGIAAAIMKNDLKRLGLKRQRMSMVDLRGDRYGET